jgi:hypothetical protein
MAELSIELSDKLAAYERIRQNQRKHSKAYMARIKVKQMHTSRSNVIITSKTRKLFKNVSVRTGLPTTTRQGRQKSRNTMIQIAQISTSSRVIDTTRSTNQ